MKNIFLITCIFLFSAFTASYTEPPEITTYKSPNNKYLLRVTPSKEVKTNKSNSISLKELNKMNCYGELYKIELDDTTLIWQKNLINNEAPGNVLITNDGLRVITFDDHYTRGYTDNDCVIYNDKGELIKRYNVSDLANGSYSGGVGFIDWLKSYEIKNKDLIITLNNLTSPSESDTIKNINTVIRIDLISGLVKK